MARTYGLPVLKIPHPLPSLTVRRTGVRTQSVRRGYGGAIGVEPEETKYAVIPSEEIIAC